MCGHLGWFTAYADRRLIPLFAGMAIQMDDRGGNSWGYYASRAPGVLGDFHKGLGLIQAGVPARSIRSYCTMIGHTRFATTGGIKEENSHPFDIGNIIGAHNGVVSNHDELNKQYSRNYEVDSMHIFGHINEERDLQEIHAYGAIVYVDKREPEKVWLGRFNGGSLSYADIYAGDKCIGGAWASTKDALKTSLNVAGFGYHMIELEEDQLYFVNTDGLWQPHKELKISEKWLKRSWHNNDYGDWSGYVSPGGIHVSIMDPVVGKIDPDVVPGENPLDTLDREFEGLVEFTPRSVRADAKFTRWWKDELDRAYVISRPCASCNQSSLPTTWSSVFKDRVCYECLVSWEKELSGEKPYPSEKLVM